ncbi:MAG: archaellum operon transcriptional activator EarA family protein [Methanocella sp.]
MEQLAVFGEDVCRSLRRSMVRRNVLLFLWLFQDAATIADIAKGIGSNYTNVLLAVEGDDDRYAVRLSLIRLGLLERENVVGTLWVYRLTSRGKSAAKKLREIGYDLEVRPGQEA